MTTWSRESVVVPGLGDTSPFAYSQCLKVGPLVFVAGQVGHDENFRVVGPDFDSQARRALHNVGLALEAAGSSLADVVSITVHVTDLRFRRQFFAIRAETFGDAPPVSAVLGTSGLASPDLLVEVQAIGVVPG